MIGMPPLWPHQGRAIHEVTEAINNGHRRILLCLPTGSGKTRIACELIRDWLHVGYKVSLYTNRKMLLDQLANVLKAFGLLHGTRSADAIKHGEMPSDDALQISSIQTEGSRTIRKKVWQLHPAERVVVDESHLQRGKIARQILDAHVAAGGVYVGLTATPIDLADMYDHLIVAAKNSELRACWALVPAIHYAPTEPDCGKIKKNPWEYTENDTRSVMKIQTIFGRILEWFGKINPERRPTLCFAPGVPESMWLCEQFMAAGISAAHIDGETCIFEGKHYDSCKEIRDRIMASAKSGECAVLCNRFVLREGVDAPFISHLILATVFGSIQTYLQSGGRGLRSCQGKSCLTVQDHGGGYWRHGSLNADRSWDLTCTEASLAADREAKILDAKGKPQEKEPDAIEPMVCPQCRKVLLTNRCSCGFVITRKTRHIVQEDGSLKEMDGDIFKAKPTKQQPNTETLWKSMYYRAKNSKRKMTFRQAEALFYRENGYYPPRNLPLMPKQERDWTRHVQSVPKECLI